MKIYSTFRIVFLYFVFFFDSYVQAALTPKVFREVKIALTGDTDAKTDFGKVLKLVAAENVDLLMINGDLGYDSSPSAWKRKITTSVNINKVPVIATLGNHDLAQKTSYLNIIQGFRNDENKLNVKCSGKTFITEWQDITAVDEVCTIENVSVIGSGIGAILTADYLETRLKEKLESAPLNNWKLVGYHYTLTSMNPGIKKKDTATQKFFDIIRQYGAIGAQAHTHSAMASCPITSVFEAGQPITCHPDFINVEERFIMPGTGLYVDSSLGGRAVRPRSRCKNPTQAGCTHMVDLISQEGYTRTDGDKKTSFDRFGALFMVFNVGGDPTKAKAFFKSVSGRIVFQFSIENRSLLN